MRIYDQATLVDSSAILQDFATAIGSVSLHDVRLPSGNVVNASYPPDILEIARACNEQLDNEGRILLRRLLEGISARMEKKSLILFSRAERRSFLAGYEETNQALAQDYLGRVPESPFAPLKDEAAEYAGLSPTSAGTVTMLSLIEALRQSRKH